MNRSEMNAELRDLRDTYRLIEQRHEDHRKLTNAQIAATSAAYGGSRFDWPLHAVNHVRNLERGQETSKRRLAHLRRLIEEMEERADMARRENLSTRG